jgi:hypothetical protein
MNSTRLLRRFFYRFIVPTSHTIKANKAQILGARLLGSEILSDSLYQSAPSGPDFTEIRAEDFAERLEAIWLGNDLPELTLLAKPVVDLAAVLREKDRGKTKTISETSYVLY